MNARSIQLDALTAMRTQLAKAEVYAEWVRDRALRDYSSDEPYENASALSVGIAKAVALADEMIREAQVGRPVNTLQAAE